MHGDNVIQPASSGAVTVNLATGTASGGDVGIDTIVGGVNAVRGSNFSDTLTGSNNSAGIFVPPLL